MNCFDLYIPVCSACKHSEVPYCAITYWNDIFERHCFDIEYFKIELENLIDLWEDDIEHLIIAAKLNERFDVVKLFEKAVLLK